MRLEQYFLQPHYPLVKPISFLFSVLFHVPFLCGEINKFNIVSQVSPRGTSVSTQSPRVNQ